MAAPLKKTHPICKFWWIFLILIYVFNVYFKDFKFLEKSDASLNAKKIILPKESVVVDKSKKFLKFN